MASRCSATTGAVASIRASWAGVSMAGGSLWVRRGGCYFKMHRKYILSDPTATPCPDAGCRTRSVGPDNRHQQPPGQHAGGHDGVGGSHGLHVFILALAEGLQAVVDQADGDAERHQH